MLLTTLATCCRADYWKSNPRHFCDFCKCWTADNKPSREFHEKGKRHQENVKKKLDDLRKKGLADAKQEKETSGYLQQMERAAMLKFRKDVTENPSLASQYGVELKRKEPEKKEEVKVEVHAECGEWCEAMTPEGYTYYWNTVTKESRWELPVKESQSKDDEDCDEVCHSPPVKKKKENEAINTESKVAELKESPEAAHAKEALECTDPPVDLPAEPPVDLPATSALPSDFDISSIELPPSSSLMDDNDISSIELPKCNLLPGDTDSSTCELQTKGKAQHIDAESAAADENCTSESSSNTVAVSQPSGKTTPPVRLPRPSPSSAYGTWQQIANDSEEEVDLELPVDAYKVEQKIIVANEPKIKFREKKVTSLSGAATAGGPSVGFRKPKAGIQRSIRTSDNTDES